MPRMLWMAALLFCLCTLGGTSERANADCEIDTIRGSTPAVWLIKRQRAYIYLLGSVHVLGKDSAPFGDAVDRAFFNSQRIYMEVDPDAISTVQMNRFVLNKAQLLGTKYSLDVTDSGRMDRVENILRKKGFSEEMIYKYKPWF